MGERTDNINVIWIADKQNFMSDMLKGIQTLDNVLYVDICGYIVGFLAETNVEEVFKQMKSNQFVWIRKEHI